MGFLSTLESEVQKVSHSVTNTATRQGTDVPHMRHRSYMASQLGLLCFPGDQFTGPISAQKHGRMSPPLENLHGERTTLPKFMMRGTVPLGSVSEPAQVQRAHTRHHNIP